MSKEDKATGLPVARKAFGVLGHVLASPERPTECRYFSKEVLFNLEIY